MVKISRREFVAGASAVILTRPLVSGSLIAHGSPPRLARKDCYFGLHFDIHPTKEDTDLGRDVTEEMISHLLESCRPDFIQYDSKGHPGYLGFPSKTGMSAPGIVKDSLAIWRRVTASHGVALYNHFSGVLDGAALIKHPEWARVGPDGQVDLQETSLFSAYEDELMIPELIEAAINYDLDGSWVDGDCWAVNLDYSEVAQVKFHEKTGIGKLPRKPEDNGWHEFLDLQREQFRRYVSRYVDALHHAKPGFQITSNWMYSTFVPERPSVALDYLSGDIADVAGVRLARIEARYFSNCGKPWDMMSWGFERDEGFGYLSDKPVVELQQEAAIVLAQGGAYQYYHGPTRSGWIDDRLVNTVTDLGKFCRARQRWLHRSESLAEVGVLHSGKTLYSTSGRPFGEWGKAEMPVAGAVDLLLACGYSVDLIPDWLLAERATQYPLILVPDWRDIGDEAVGILARYAAQGGKLFLVGAENVRLFSIALNLKFRGASEERTCLVADESGFAEITGHWFTIEAPQDQVVANAYRTSDSRKDLLPFAVRIKHGNGTVVVCPGPVTSTYGFASSPILRSVMESILQELHTPMVRLDGDFPAVEIVLRQKDGQALIHFINTAGAPTTGEFRHTGVVAHTGPIRIRLRLLHAPYTVILEPEGKLLTGAYESGEWRGILPDLHVHSFLRITGKILS